MIFFYFSEAFRSIKSAKTTFALTTVSLTISVLLILFSFITIKISNYYSSELTSNIKINVFLKNSFAESDKDNLLITIEEKSYTKKVEFISKDEAAEKFIEETGEDFRRILDYNPLPASVVVSLNENYTVSDSLNHIINDLSGLSSVDEVVFKEGFVYRLLNFIDKFKIYLFAMTGLFSLIAVYLVYATIRLIIHSRMIDFETMKLVGSKLSTIKIPVLLNGLIAGIISGGLAYTIVSLINKYLLNIEVFNNMFIKDYNEFLIIILAAGPVLALIVSWFSLRKVSLKI